LALLVGPVLIYMGFGALWLFDRGWLLIAGVLWVLAGIVFAVLAARWTRSPRELLPPIDWDAPQTFSRIDREAWAIVEQEADQGDQISLEALTEFDVYIDTGRRLARRLAEHYHPLSTDPIDNVPVVDLLTALELASEDLGHLCRQVPGGDMITPSHWKKAVQVAGYIQRANEIYSYLLPIFSPVTGLVRLGTQQWMVKPAWKDMQQNLLRWFFRAFVNRLGVHLIELYSGRLSIGTDRYRRLTRRRLKTVETFDGDMPPLRVAVAGARDSGKSRLIALLTQLNQAHGPDLALVKARLRGTGVDESALERLRAAQWFEIPGYTHSPGGESARDRATRREAVAQAVEADLLVLVVDARRDTISADLAFAQAWDRWYVEHPNAELPPAVAVLTALDDPTLGGEWKPPYNWEAGQGPRETAVRARINALRTALPASFTEVVPVGLPESQPFGVVENLIPTLVTLLHRAERAALIRHLHSVAARSKARRLLTQVGAHGRTFWGSLRGRRHAYTPGNEP
jgi:predicted GTPase